MNDDGTIAEIIDPLGETTELASTEFHNGIIVPGFVNTHCHTELSHFKGKFSPGTGLWGFVEQVRNLRLENSELPEVKIEESIAEMYRQGTVAAADICNTSDSFFAKQNSPIRFVNLVEVLGLDSEKADLILDRATFLAKFHEFKPGDSAQLTPHSTYTLSEKLWEKLANQLEEKQLISIHFAESKAEAEFTENRKGKLADTFQSWGLPINSNPLGNQVEIVKKYIPPNSRVLFVHNTFLTKADVLALKECFKNAFFSFCPESNLFIENTLPDVLMLIETGIPLTLGTDSLASSSNLSILQQMLIIQQQFPSIPFAEFLTWATLNGAKALSIDGELGSIEMNKKPGLNLISPFDFKNMRLLPNSKAKRLV